MGYVDHYKILGLPSGVEGSKISEKDISKAYKKKALELHPDKRRDDPNAKTDFQKLQASYEILKNEKTRKDFDATFVVRVNKQDLKRKRQPTTGFEEEEDLKRKRQPTTSFEEKEEEFERETTRKMSEFERRKRAAVLKRQMYEVNERKRMAEFEEIRNLSEERKRRAAFAYGSNPKQRILNRMQINKKAKKTYFF